MAGLYEMHSDKLLFEEMRKTPSTSFQYIEMKAELDLRVALRTLESGTAQVRSAWYQLAAVVMMFLTAIATAVVPLWLATHH